MEPCYKPMIQLKRVWKRFGKLDVLKGVDLSVPEGATVAIIGPSGSGKSTLVRCLNHLEPIQDGSIDIDGFQITPRGIEKDQKVLAPREVANFRTRLGMVFQQFNLFPHLTVLGNVLEAPLGVLGRNKKEVAGEAVQLLSQVGLGDKIHQFPARLSGGQQQRVAIVRSLLMHPKIMLFDEPTSALDPELIGEVLKVIAELAIRGRTSIIVTHELAFAREVASSIVFMDDGLIVEEGAPAEVLTEPKQDRYPGFHPPDSLGLPLLLVIRLRCAGGRARASWGLADKCGNSSIRPVPSHRLRTADRTDQCRRRPALCDRARQPRGGERARAFFMHSFRSGRSRASASG
jgi:polar amino acid transport system ATP-binding protein